MLGIGSNADILAFDRLILSFIRSILCKPIVAYVAELKATLFIHSYFALWEYLRSTAIKNSRIRPLPTVWQKRKRMDPCVSNGARNRVI